MSDIECPYCGAELNIDHDDGKGYHEGELHTQECSSCDRIFGFWTSIHTYYEAVETPCLNDGVPHDWLPTRTHPKRFTKMRCVHCYEERELTGEERERLGC